MYVFSIHPTPATLDTNFLYVQFLSSMLSPSAIRNYLTGVKLLHLFSGQEFPFNKDFILLLTLRGIAHNALHIRLVTPHVFLSRKLRCCTRISGLKKSRNNTREKNIVFFHVCWYTQLAAYTSLAFGAIRSGWWMNSKVFTILNYKLFVGAFSNYGG